MNINPGNVDTLLTLSGGVLEISDNVCAFLAAAKYGLWGWKIENVEIGKSEWDTRVYGTCVVSNDGDSRKFKLRLMGNSVTEAKYETFLDLLKLILKSKNTKSETVVSCHNSGNDHFDPEKQSLIMSIDAVLIEFGNAIIQTLCVNGEKIPVGASFSTKGNINSLDYAKRIIEFI